ncbi:hypothetical protein F5B21DRAFT_249306 [Xylaria acuta]|nr:hypothetical protein F5B21DRAFT_249306 [Xylaria acuta]
MVVGAVTTRRIVVLLLWLWWWCIVGSVRYASDASDASYVSCVSCVSFQASHSRPRSYRSGVARCWTKITSQAFSKMRTRMLDGLAAGTCRTRPNLPIPIPRSLHSGSNKTGSYTCSVIVCMSTLDATGGALCRTLYLPLCSMA